MDTDELIVDSSEPGVVQLLLNRPHQLNAWTLTLEAAFFDALDTAREDPGVRVVVVSGVGRGFCSGASRDMLGGAARPAGRRRQLGELLDFPKPVIAAVNGPAVGLGLALALVCDVRICSRDAILTTAFARLGLVAEHATAWLLPRIIGSAAAAELLLSGRTVTGSEAADMGLVTRAVEPGAARDEALAYARMLVDTGAPSSWSTIKQQLFQASASTWAEANSVSLALMETALASADHREAIEAGAAGRAPMFSAYRSHSEFNTTVDE